MKNVDTKHYDVFNYELTKEDVINGSIRLDPYQVALLWGIGTKDPSGCLFHMFKTISRFGVKEGNTVEREIASLKATLARMEQLYKTLEN
jgi:hypothetical protein